MKSKEINYLKNILNLKIIIFKFGLTHTSAEMTFPSAERDRLIFVASEINK
jgi:hypothetical protein